MNTTDMTMKQFLHDKVRAEIIRKKGLASEEEQQHYAFLEQWVSTAIVDKIAASDDFSLLLDSMTKRFVGEAEQDILIQNNLRQPEDYDTINVVNLTKHEVNLYAEDSDEMIAVIPKSDHMVRVMNTPSIVKRANLRLQDGTIIKNIPFVHNKRLEGGDLPAPKPGTFYIVSALVLEVNPYREDLICINTSNEDLGVIRKNGIIVGSRSLRPSPRGLYARLVV